MYGNRDYVVGITGLDYEADEAGFEFLKENTFFFSERPNRLLGPLRLLLNGNRHSFLVVRLTKREFYRSLPSGVEVENEGS
jgi:hypothetical protein